MNGEQLIKKLSERIGELEVQNIMLQMQIEEMAKKLKESEGANNERAGDWYTNQKGRWYKNISN